MKIAVNSFFTKSYFPLAEITVKEMQKYCQKHDYFFLPREVPDGDIDFIKTVDARNLLENFDLVFTIECDCLITNHTIKVESFIDDEHDFFICNDINGANGGVFIVKNTKNGKNWLDVTNEAKSQFKTEQNVWEMISTPYVKYLPHPSINSFPMDYYGPFWGKIGAKDGDIIPKPTHEQGAWEIGDFVCHLPGMTLHDRVRIFNDLKQHIIYE